MLLRLYLCVWVFALIVDSCVYLFVALECLTKVDLILMRSADLYKHTHALTDSLIFVVFFFFLDYRYTAGEEGRGNDNYNCDVF